MSAPLGWWVLHGGPAGDVAIDLHWPVVLAFVVGWGVVGGGLYWYYTNQLDER